ncbi:MAG: RNA helicase [Methanomicrobiaceae archaeon]|nr:RNA helicase [Methanomicrobiaceae archaeon]
MITSKAKFRGAKKLRHIVGFRVPESVFRGPFLEAVSACINYQKLDRRVKEQLIHFFKDFLDCKCRQNPLCGCPERKFVKMIIDLRISGLDHRQISEVILDEYGIELTPADILSFLESSVHILESIKDISAIEGKGELSAETARLISSVSR